VQRVERHDDHTSAALRAFAARGMKTEKAITKTRKTAESTKNQQQRNWSLCFDTICTGSIPMTSATNHTFVLSSCFGFFFVLS
jgi:hypothetical protein